MEEKISPSELKLRTIMQGAPLGLIEITNQGVIQNINRKAEEITSTVTGLSLQISENVFPFTDLISPSISSEIIRFNRPEGLIFNNQVHILTISAGSVYYYQFTAAKMLEDCIMLTIDDITNKLNEEQSLIKAEQEKAVAQGKYEIASEVLHDIGNAIVGFGTHLTRLGRTLDSSKTNKLDSVVLFLKQQQPQLSDALGIAKAEALITMLAGISSTNADNQRDMSQAVSEQLRIVNHIQDILSIQRQYVLGHEPQERNPVSLNVILADCQSMVMASIEKKNIDFRMIVPEANIHIKGDRTKLMQVILNLLKNSIEAIDPSSALKTVQVLLSETDHKVLLKIEDTGTGIPADILQNLFTRGFTTKQEGTGLGLYNCRSIIESHGGLISVNSNGPGTGTTVGVAFNK
jgi:signal transduction histidine kinase